MKKQVLGSINANSIARYISLWGAGSSYSHYLGTLTCTGCDRVDPSLARTDAELKQQSTYQGWDFYSVWQIDEGVSYPTLQ